MGKSRQGEAKPDPPTLAFLSFEGDHHNSTFEFTHHLTLSLVLWLKKFKHLLWIDLPVLSNFRSNNTILYNWKREQHFLDCWTCFEAYLVKKKTGSCKPQTPSRATATGDQTPTVDDHEGFLTRAKLLQQHH